MLHKINIFNYFKKKKFNAILIYFLFLNFTGLFQNLWEHRLYDKGWTIGEWLINYNGGFVRRGLFGSIIFKVSESCQINPILIVQLISLISFLIFLFFLTRCKEYFSNVFLFSPIVSLSPLLGNFLVRKDIFGIVSYVLCLFLVIDNKKIKEFILVNFISIIAILNHESYFFYAIPSLFFIKYISIKCKTKNIINKKTLFSSLIFFIPSYLSFVLVFLFKGDSEIANQIHYSWQKLSHLIPTQGKLFNLNSFDAINQIGWNATNIKDLLIRSLFGDLSFSNNGLIYIPGAWIVTIFIVAQIFIGDKNKAYSKLKSKIIILQFLSISPLFFLGVDYGRWIFLWITSSIFLTYSIIKISTKNNFKINNLEKKISAPFSNFLKGYTLKNNWQYLYLFISIPHCCWTLMEYIEKIPASIPYFVFMKYKAFF